MKILVTGAFGQLGRAVYRTLSNDHEVIRTGRFIPIGESGIKLNIQDRINVKNIIDLIKPELIINLAALTNVDHCENNKELAKEINVGGVINLCECFEGKIIQVSTDYVFNGENGPYDENDKVSPISIYGKTKLAAEKIIMNSGNNNLVLRTNVLYDYIQHTNASFLNWVINSLKNSKPINVVTDQINNPTWTYSLADIIDISITKDLSGIFHWGDADFLNRFNFAIKIADKFSLNKTLINPITTDQLKQSAKRPLKSGLLNDKLVKRFGIIPPKIEDCLNMIIKNR